MDLTAPALTPLLCPRLVGPPRATNLPLHQRLVAKLSPRRRGCRPAVAPRPLRRERPVAGAPVPVPARWESLGQGQRLPSRGLGP